MSEAEAKTKIGAGAMLTYGASLADGGNWIGWVHDGKKLIQLPPRGSRDIALNDARNHKDRLLNPPLPKKIWRPSKG